MKVWFLALALLLGLVVTGHSQEDEEDAEVVLPAPVMEQVVKRMVRWYFKPPKKPKTIYFSAENIRKEWLPKIKNIEFVLLEKPERYPYERKVYRFEEVDVSGRGFRIPFSYGDGGCHTLKEASAGDTWSFRVRGSTVYALKPVWMNWRGICAGG